MKKEIDDKIKKNIYDLSHDRYLQLFSIILSGGISVILLIGGIILTLIINKQLEINSNNIIAIFSIFSLILFGMYIFSFPLRIKMINLVSQIKELDL